MENTHLDNCHHFKMIDMQLLVTHYYQAEIIVYVVAFYYCHTFYDSLHTFFFRVYSLSVNYFLSRIFLKLFSLLIPYENKKKLEIHKSDTR